MRPTHNSIPLAARKKVIAQLSPLLSDAQDLYSQVKQAHWNVKGANFISLHQLFDAIGTEVNEAVDTIAERIIQLGGETKGTLRAAAKQSRLKEYPLASADGAKHVDALAAALGQFTSFSRKAIDDTDAAGDAVTADMLTSITSGLDKQLWFIEVHNTK